MHQISIQKMLDDVIKSLEHPIRLNLEKQYKLKNPIYIIV